MDSEFRPLSLDLFRGPDVIDHALLMAARRHVGAAGIEQTAALERLIAAGQEHTGLTVALQKVNTLLQNSGNTQALNTLLDESQQQLLILHELAGIVTQALQQITATPVVRVSVQVLEDIANRMHQRLYALNRLVERIELSPAVPDSATPGLEAVLAALEAELLRIRHAEHEGRLQTLIELACQAIQDISAQEPSEAEDRRAALNTIVDFAKAERAALT